MKLNSISARADMIPHELKQAGIVSMLLVFVFWSYQLLRPYPVGETPWIFLDYLNLLFHEAGHWVFGLAGQTIGILGGSLMQCIIPLLVIVSFIRSDDLPGVGFGVFWLGNNVINVSYYIADSQSRQFQLLGGDSTIHDWQWLLTKWQLITYAEILGMAVKVLGAGLLLLSIALLLLSLMVKVEVSTSKNET